MQNKLSMYYKDGTEIGKLSEHPMYKKQEEIKEPVREKLQVEFEVEKTVKHPYGYEEKFLLYDNKRTGHKAIIQNAILANIVGRLYKLIPNEDVITKVTQLATEKNLSLNIETYDWRVYCILFDTVNRVGIMVSNGVDGTVALRVDALIENEYTKNSYNIMVGNKWSSNKEIRNVYRKHSANLEIADLSIEMDTMLKTAIEYREELKKLDSHYFHDHFDTIKGLFENVKMPDIYTKEVMVKFWIGSKPSLRDIYEKISAKIWNKKENDMRTKIQLFKKLNDVMMMWNVVDEI